MELLELHKELSKAENRYTKSKQGKAIKDNLIKKLKNDIRIEEITIELYVKYIMRKRVQFRKILGYEPSKRTLHNVSKEEFKIIYSHLIK